MASFYDVDDADLESALRGSGKAPKGRGRVSKPKVAVSEGALRQAALTLAGELYSSVKNGTESPLLTDAQQKRFDKFLESTATSLARRGRKRI